MADDVIEEALDRLFANGSNEKADRLLLVQESHSGAAQVTEARYLGGYNRAAVRGIIQDIADERVAALARLVEWVDRGDHHACPGCGNWKEENGKHNPECPIGNALVNGASALNERVREARREVWDAAIAVALSVESDVSGTTGPLSDTQDGYLLGSGAVLRALKVAAVEGKENE